MTTLDAALPVTGKRPLIAGGFHAASRDAEAVRGWWTTWPEAGIGVPIGPGVLLVVEDARGARLLLVRGRP